MQFSAPFCYFLILIQIFTSAPSVWWRCSCFHSVVQNVFLDKSGLLVDCVWNVMAHAQKPDFVFRRNGRVHLNRLGRQFSRLLAAEVCASAVVMLDTPCSEVVWRVLATHSIRQFPLHFSSRASPSTITFQLDSTNTTSNTNIITTNLSVMCVWYSLLKQVSQGMNVACYMLSVYQ